MSDGHALRLRRVRFRLRRQGMAELDNWLSALEVPLEQSDMAFIRAVEHLLSCEPPELVAMMRGKSPLPEGLRPWLSSPKRDVRAGG